MNKELIDEIRNVLNFMEEFDTLVGKAQKTGDTERENELYAGECSARHRLRELVNSSWETYRKSRRTWMESRSDNKIRNKLAQSQGIVYLCTAKKTDVRRLMSAASHAA